MSLLIVTKPWILKLSSALDSSLPNTFIKKITPFAVKQILEIFERLKENVCIVLIKMLKEHFVQENNQFIFFSWNPDAWDKFWLWRFHDKSRKAWKAKAYRWLSLYNLLIILSNRRCRWVCILVRGSGNRRISIFNRHCLDYGWVIRLSGQYGPYNKSYAQSITIWSCRK